MMMRLSVNGLLEAQLGSDPIKAITTLARGYILACRTGQALLCYETSATLGDADSYCQIGNLLSDSREKCYDLSMAKTYYLRAIDLGSESAVYKLSEVYYKLGMYTKALERFELTYKKYPEARYYLGLMYETGKGVRKNLSQALKFFQIAHFQGEMQSLERIKANNRIPYNQIPDIENFIQDENNLFQLFEGANELPAGADLTCTDVAPIEIILKTFDKLIQATHDGLDFEKFERIMTVITARDPENAEISKRVGLIKSKFGKFNEAMQYFQLALSKHDTELFYTIGMNFKDRLNRMTLAEYLEAYYLCDGRIASEKAEQLITSWDSVGIGMPMLLLNIALSQGKTHPTSFAELLDAIVTHPDVDESEKLYVQGMICFYQRKYESAATNFEAIKAGEPKLMAKASLYLARIYKMNGSMQELSLLHYKSAYKLAIDLPAIRRIVLTDLENLYKAGQTKKIGDLLVKLYEHEADFWLREIDKMTLSHAYVSSATALNLANIYLDYALQLVGELRVKEDNSNTSLLFLQAQIYSIETERQDQAFALFQQLADQGHVDSQFQIALCYAKSLLGKTKDLYSAVEVLTNIVTGSNPCDPDILAKIVDLLLAEEFSDELIIMKVQETFYLIVNNFKPLLNKDHRIIIGKKLCANNLEAQALLGCQLLEENLDNCDLSNFCPGSIRPYINEYIYNFSQVKDDNLRAIKNNEVAVGVCLFTILNKDDRENRFWVGELKNSDNAVLIDSFLKSIFLKMHEDKNQPYYLPALKKNHPGVFPMVLLLLAYHRFVQVHDSIEIPNKKVAEVFNDSVEPTLILFFKTFLNDLPPKYIELSIYPNLKKQMRALNEVVAKNDSDLATEHSINLLKKDIYQHVFNPKYLSFIWANNMISDDKRAICTDMANQIFIYTECKNEIKPTIHFDCHTMAELQSNANLKQYLKTQYPEFYGHLQGQANETEKEESTYNFLLASGPR
jgi:TPR repeat protein